MLKRFFPWKFLVKRAARRFGVIDPVTFLARFRRFSQPSEVQEPIELLRAGIVFHARGLINTKAIQHNLDWVWPYWVERQFNPDDPSFIPRAFSISHVNLTHRNWTAVGWPDLPLYPIVDPRGLVTPFFDGWSLDFWIIPEDGPPLLPSRLQDAGQVWNLENGLSMDTTGRQDGLELFTTVKLAFDEDGPALMIDVTGSSDRPASLVMSIRPYNPEGVQFIEKIDYIPRLSTWMIDGETRIVCDSAPDSTAFSNYEEGDVLHRLFRSGQGTGITCETGLANAAGLYSLEAGTPRTIHICLPMADELERHCPGCRPVSRSWPETLAGTAGLTVPDPVISRLYDEAVRTVILLTALDPLPGPYTYRRFWFRDACFMLNALLALGMTARCRRILDSFPGRQNLDGYFRSQTGEWDSNGQVIWIMQRYLALTRDTPGRVWLDSVFKGADWIRRKRSGKGRKTHHPGLLPPGFSAEHLGPNDYYYWDDFWGLAGLKAAASLAEAAGREDKADELAAEAAAFETDIFRSVGSIPERRSRGGIPASPHRRMDSGAVGSLVADYPLQLTPEGDHRIRHTVEFLLENCLHEGGFFQDMIHSGINAYLTLALAQTLLRFGDDRFRSLVEATARLASPTGQWPEAVHPITLGGCMGDGQHGWAAAEWVLMIRSLFVREEPDRLVLCSGLFGEWLDENEELAYGPTPTPYGPLTVRLSPNGSGRILRVEAQWFDEPPLLDIRVPGLKPVLDGSGREEFLLEAERS